MPKSKVQFQKGLSLKAFLDRSGCEAHCEQALIRIRWPDGLDCPACGSSRFCRLHSRRLLQCNRCKRQVSLLAGTIFQSTKLPLSTWLLALYLPAQAFPPNREREPGIAHLSEDPGNGTDRFVSAQDELSRESGFVLTLDCIDTPRFLF